MSDSAPGSRVPAGRRIRPADARQIVEALARGEVDSVSDGSGATPLLLREAQEKLRGSERLLRAVFDGALDGLILIDLENVFLDANPAACALFGLPKERLVGRRIEDFAERDYDLDGAMKALVRERHLDGSARLVREDGQVREVDYRTTAEVVPGIHLSVLRDMTEKRRAESRFRALIEKSSDVVMLSRADTTIVFTSPPVTAVLGYDPAELVGRLVYDLVHPDDHAPAREQRRMILADPSRTSKLDCRMRHKDGTWRWVACIGRNLLDDPAVGGVIVNFRDITGSRLAEEGRARLAAIVESSDDAILGQDLEGVITSWNRGAERLYQWSEAEAVGKGIGILAPAGAPGDMPPGIGGLLDGEAVHRETTLRRKDGTPIEVALTVSPIRDAAGRVTGLSQVAQDLTARRDTEAKLRQAQKMEAIGALAGSVAHDFNNLLSVILGYASLLLDDLAPGSALRGHVEEMQRAGERAAGLTNQLLAFSRKQVLQPLVLDLSKVVLGMKKLLERLLCKGIVLVLETPAANGMVVADPGQVEQVLMNLAVNSRDSMPQGGTLKVEVADAVLDRVDLAGDPGLEPGAYVMLAVSDTGTGMDAATRARISEPFFTTKEPGRGTGLGLATVFGIVKQGRGHIRVQSAPGAGTTFRIYLPRTDRAPEPLPRTQAPPETLRGRETVLLVEDEDQVREVAATILRRHGYTVLEARNGGEAFLICEQARAAIDLLLTDVVMPRMSGPELAIRLRPMWPELGVLYMSGFAGEAGARLRGTEAGVRILQKPFTPDALLLQVRRVLDGRAPEPHPPGPASPP